MDITSIDKNKIRAAQTGKIQDPTRVKFEMVSHNPYEVKKKRSILGGLFRFLGIASKPAFFFPGVGTAVGAAGLGADSLGSHLQTKAAVRSQPQDLGQPLQMTTPGLGGRGQSASVSDPVLNLISASREDSLYSSAQAIQPQ